MPPFLLSLFPSRPQKCLLITDSKKGGKTTATTHEQVFDLVPCRAHRPELWRKESKKYDKNIKGNILSFEKFMIYEFCLAERIKFR
jgi:hypothetical protein